MVINNKKGYLHTLEAIIAVVILLIVVFSSVSLKESKAKNVPTEIELMQDRILFEVQSNDLLRNYLITNERDLLLDYIKNNMGQENINLDLDICFEVSNCEVRSDTLSTGGDVYVGSLVIHELGSTVIFRLYLWYDVF